MSSRLPHAGASSYEWRKGAYVYLASILLAVGLACLSVTVVFPWWRVTRPLLPVLPVLQLVCIGLAPVVFITGFAGCGSVAAALREAETELRLLMR